MAMPQHYLIALISPGGRLGQFHFALLAVLIAFAHIYLYFKMGAMPKDQPWNIYSISILLLIWCKFCILSRRMHDTGSNGLIAVPVLIIAIACYLLVIDPSVAGIEKGAPRDPNVDYLIKHAMKVPRAIFIAVFIYCIRAGGESGPNGYGPEFGDSGDGVSAAQDALDKKRDSTVAVHSFKRIKSDDDKGWGQRKRPAGFGRR
ncbi:MAG: DUF805 domain-containing protein [Hyphomicrobiaceae bacterium]